MLIEHGDVQTKLDEMRERNNFNWFTLSRLQQNRLNPSAFVERTVKVIRESECSETLIVFEQPSHRMDDAVARMSKAIARAVEIDHPILAICVDTEYYNALKAERARSVYGRSEFSVVGNGSDLNTEVLK